MKKIILPALLLITSTIIGQNCKYKINEIDEFTKNKVLETKGGLLTMSGLGFGFSCSYSFKKINDIKFLNLSITSPSIFTLRQGRDIMFKTDKEETVILNFAETIVAEFVSGSRIGTMTSPSFWTGSILIPISNENFERLVNEKVLKLRVYTGDGYVDDDISVSSAKKFKEQLKCIE
jgi:hypothetical protein